jgi:hypothetical protein
MSQKPAATAKSILVVSRSQRAMEAVRQFIIKTTIAIDCSPAIGYSAALSFLLTSEIKLQRHTMIQREKIANFNHFLPTLDVSHCLREGSPSNIKDT